MKDLGSKLSYANVMSSIAVFAVLAGGTAWAVDEFTGANIQNGTLTSADYRNNDIRSADVRDDTRADGGLIGADIAADSLTAADVADTSSLGGAEIAESTLSGVNAASLASVGLGSIIENDKAETNLCDPDSSTEILCDQTGLTLERTTRVLLIGSLSFNTNTGGAAGVCRIAADGVIVDSNSIGENSDTTDAAFELQEATMIGITSNQAPGTHDYELRCREEVSDITFNEAELVAVSVGPDSGNF
jgi:uncharacterized protein YjbI with pentapeptide repeats